MVRCILELIDYPPQLGVVLFEQLGEEYPDTLGSIIAAEGAIANVVGMTQMQPPVKDLREYLAFLAYGGVLTASSAAHDTHSA